MYLVKFGLLSSALLVSINLPLAALAADGMKAGQWTISMKNDMMKGMPAIPPEQLAQMKKLGINIPSGGGQGMEVQTCVTPEQAKLDAIPPQQDKDCKIQNFKRSGNKYTGDMVCTGEMKAKGKFEMTLDSNTAYRSVSSIKGVTSDGTPIDTTMESSGKWVKSKCDPNVASYGQQK